MKKILTAFLFFFVFQFMAVSQNFDKITQIISTDEITYAQAAYIAAFYTGDVTNTSDEKAAFDSLKAKGFFKESDNPDLKINLGALCSLFAKVTNKKGGLMFMITKKSPRYAFKEFIAKGFLPRDAVPSAKVKGADALGLFNVLTGGAK